jgi:hypothetical protein
MLEMFEKLGRRDRIALGVGVGATALFLLLNFGVLPLLEGLGASPEAVQQKESELRREKQLLAAEALEKARLSAARERLTGLEASLLESSTPSLANAEWQRLVRQLAESKDIELGSSELLRTQDLGAGYSLVTGRALFRCRLDQLVALLAAIAVSPKLLSVSGLSVFASQSDSQGRMSVQLTIGAAARTAKPAKELPAAH